MRTSLCIKFHCDEHFVVAQREILVNGSACLRLASKRVMGEIGCIASLWDFYPMEKNPRLL